MIREFYEKWLIDKKLLQYSATRRFYNENLRKFCKDVQNWLCHMNITTEEKMFLAIKYYIPTCIE